jgi:hypothetical protein
MKFAERVIETLENIADKAKTVEIIIFNSPFLMLPAYINELAAIHGK